tara:strand:+ start:202 stop:459 length:258 start_codon:yes stop_codon:yes gene_type:complete
MTPQELIDLPGHGKAKEQLVKQGDWPEDDETKEPRYMTIRVYGYEGLEVAAKSHKDGKYEVSLYGDFDKILDMHVIYDENEEEIK